MADKAEKKPEAAPAAAPDKHEKAAGAGSFFTKLPVLLGGIMILEAAVLFAGFKFLGSGASNANAGATLVEPEAEHGGESSGHGEEGGHGDGKSAGPKKGNVEVKVLEFKAPNKLSGRTFIYDVSIYAVTTGAHEEELKTVMTNREATIKDRVRTIIAQMDPDKLGGGSEPGLETLRRQIKYQLDELGGEGVIEEVLVPRCIPFRADF